MFLRKVLRASSTLPTALNFFCLDLARLSVDIDLNYIAHIDREFAERERPEIVTRYRVSQRAMELRLVNLGFISPVE